MRLKDFSIFLGLIAVGASAQQKISGSVTDGAGMPVKGVEVYDHTGNTTAHTANDGTFVLDTDDAGARQLTFSKAGFALYETTVTPPAQLEVKLLQSQDLSAVIIQKDNTKRAALRKLKDVEGTAIYAGKKTEVVAVGNLTANKATNNTRQIFAQVTGLTINESADGGLQLSIGGRGLNPNRTSNFNTRQNGYDISADVLGYPESYYAPPTEAIDEIQVVRGAASLQYGTQFGGLVNFKLKAPAEVPVAFETRNTVGSFGLFTNFTSLSGAKGKFSYYANYNYKQADGFRPNSNFDSRQYFVNLNYAFSDRTSLHLDYTHFDYLAHQPGGLSDKMFYEDPTQSNRARNWFSVDWNLFALRLEQQIGAQGQFSLQLFGLDASRKTVGFRPNRASTDDIPGTVRDLITGDFVNWGGEARYLQKYGRNRNTFLIGAKYYQSSNSAVQGPGSAGNGADFRLATDAFPYYQTQSNYKFPNLNVAVFGEHIFRLSSRFSLTPGFRFESIRTRADGYYRQINLDLAGNVLLDQTVPENNVKNRGFALFGLGASFKSSPRVEWYANVSQNYRSVTFNDIRTAIPNQQIDPNISDEKGYTSDVGVRGKIGKALVLDANVFGLYYNDKIGDLQVVGSNGAPTRLRTNIGTAFTYGFETLADWRISDAFFEDEQFVWNVFGNLSLNGSEYLESDQANIKGNAVEFVPLVNLKAGTGMGYGNFMASVQLTYLSDQFSDASNSTVDKDDNFTGISGKIPAYYVADFSASYKWRWFKLEAGVTNFTNVSYFTRRATGYPGPGIIPSDPRSFYTTLEFRF